MKDTIRQSIALARRYLIDHVWSGVCLEALKVTFPDTQSVVQGVMVNGMADYDAQKILNLKHAWEFLFSTLSKGQDITVSPEALLGFAEKINGFVAYNESMEWGVLRSGGVTIAGTDWVPPVPRREDVLEQLSSLKDVPLSYWTWAQRAQLFWDGNKRTSHIVANAIMIQKGQGIFFFARADVPEFNRLLTEFYNSGNDKRLINFAEKRRKLPLIKPQELGRGLGR